MMQCFLSTLLLRLLINIILVEQHYYYSPRSPGKFHPFTAAVF